MDLDFNDLLKKNGIDPDKVLVLRHRPKEPELRKALPWLAIEHPDVFNAYQATQNPRAESAMSRSVYVAAFIGHEPGKAVFVGLYRQCGSRPVAFEELRKQPAFQALERLGNNADPPPPTQEFLLFDLQLTAVLSDWKGRLIIRWPPPELSWFRWAGRSQMAIDAILEESSLVRAMPDWRELVLTWAELPILPAKWRAALGQWRGVYFIFDVVRRAGYVGSACGEDNLLGRWRAYAKTGHGGNKRLRQSEPDDLRFSILELTAQDLDAKQVVALENRWKDKLHTRGYQLNEPSG